MSRDWLVAGLLFVLVPGICAKDKKPKTYPEHGTVVAKQTQRSSRTAGVYTDPYGKIQGGGSHIMRIPVYKIRTETMDYEFEGKRKAVLTVGADVEFRIEKDRVFIRRGDKEERFILAGQEKRDSK